MSPSPRPGASPTRRPVRASEPFLFKLVAPGESSLGVLLFLVNLFRHAFLLMTAAAVLLAIGSVLAACVGLSAVFVVYVVRLALYPEIVKFPYNAEEGEKEGSAAVYAGSFNPPHNGHLSILKAAHKRFGKVYAVIGHNPKKKYPVTPEDRAKLLKHMLARLDMKDIEVHCVSGLIWRFAQQKNAVMVRGIRSWEKDGNDETFLNLLNILGPILLGPFFGSFPKPMKTIFFESSPKFSHLSSSLLRNCRKHGKPVYGADRI